MSPTFAQYRNRALLVKAMAGIAGPWRLWLVGHGNQAVLMETAASLGLRDKIAVFTDVSDPAALLQAADLFVLPSNIEGLPLAIIEAMLTALPIVATAVGGVPELVEHGSTGLLTASGDEHALRSCITEVLGMPDPGRLAMGMNGRAAAMAKFSLESRRPQLLALYGPWLNKARGLA